MFCVPLVLEEIVNRAPLLPGLFFEFRNAVGCNLLRFAALVLGFFVFVFLFAASGIYRTVSLKLSVTGFVAVRSTRKLVHRATLYVLLYFSSVAAFFESGALRGMLLSYIFKSLHFCIEKCKKDNCNAHFCIYGRQ